jgi:peptidoglycan/LPS O-acetylase OafA/YrhL
MLKPANGLNLVRMTLVMLVILSHSYTVGQYDLSPLFLGNTSGQWALAGLFAVSGYLVSSGRLRRSYATYLLHRILRLWPAFVLCLVVIAGVFAPVVWALQNQTLDGFLTAPGGPFPFLSYNVLFEIRLVEVSGTPGIDGFGWIGNLWTIFYTVLSYVILGLLLGIRDERRRLIVSAAVFVAAVVLHANFNALNAYFQDERVGALLLFLPLFIGGSMIYQLKDVLPRSLALGVLALALAVGFAAIDGRWGLQAASPLIAYGLLTLANVIPAPAYLRRNDFAMGAFMYSFAVQVLLLVLGVPQQVENVWAFFGVSLLATAPFAVFSWYAAERPVTGFLRRSEARQQARAELPPPSPRREAAAAR